MKIAYLSNYNPHNVNYWSGTPYHIFLSLSKHHEVVCIGEGIIQGAKWHHILSGKTNYFPELYQKEIGAFLSKEINKGNFDVVITNTYHFCTQLNINIPLIYFADLTYELYKNFIQLKRDYYDIIATKTEEACLKRADAIVYCSEWARSNALLNYNIPKEKTFVIEFGANIPTPKKIKKRTSDKCNLLFVGRSWENKGGKKVIDTYHHLLAMGVPCHLTIVGCKIPKEIKIDKNISIYPWLDKKNPTDLEKYTSLLQTASFFILPTKFDAFGIVLCEACAYGVPCIASNTGGVHQIIKNGHNGFLLPENASSEDYAATIYNTYNNLNLYKKLCKNARHEFKQRLNWDIWVKKIEKIFFSLQNIHTEQEQHQYYIPTYIINLPKRDERKKHIAAQFKDKEEFSLTYIDAIWNECGALGLWESIKKVINLAITRNEDIIIICEDDHTFTSEYNATKLFSHIIEARKKGAEILSGGISNFDFAVPVNRGLFYVNRFLSTQFIVLFRPIFNKIQNYTFQKGDAADLILPRISKCNMVIYPFISIQKNFGYSDVTTYHNEHPDFITQIFKHSNIRLKQLDNIYRKYHYFEGEGY